MILYNGFDTLVFSTTDFYLHDKDEFYKQKELAGNEQLKEVPFMYSVDGKYFSDKYEGGEKVTKIFNLKGNQGFIMKSKSYNPFAWTFNDKDKKYQFSVVWAEDGKNIKKIFQVKILAKTFFCTPWKKIKEELQEIVSVFGIELGRMKVKRIDWATDIRFAYKKLNWFIRDERFSKVFFTRYGSMKAPVDVIPYCKNFKLEKNKKKSGLQCTGLMLGSKSVKLRIYDKILESIEKYSDHPEKSEMVLEAYYKKEELKLSSETGTELDKDSFRKTQVDINSWNDSLLREYLQDKMQVVRFEYQLAASYLENKFRYVSDLDLEEVKSMIYDVFMNHTGIIQEELDRDLKRYIKAIRSEEDFVNKYSKIAGTIEGKIIHAVRRIGGGLASLGISLSEKSERVVSFGEVATKLDFFRHSFFLNYSDKMWNNAKLIFSQEFLKGKNINYEAFCEGLEEYRESVAIAPTPRKEEKKTVEVEKILSSFKQLEFEAWLMEDEIEYLLSSKVNEERLIESTNQAENGETVSFSIEELEKNVNEE